MLSAASSTGSISAAVRAGRRAKHHFVRELRGKHRCHFQTANIRLGIYPFTEIPFSWRCQYCHLHERRAASLRALQAHPGLSAGCCPGNAGTAHTGLVVLRKRTSLTSGNIFFNQPCEALEISVILFFKRNRLCSSHVIMSIQAIDEQF